LGAFFVVYNPSVPGERERVRELFRVVFMSECMPRIIIAGTQSGTGKTSLSLALVASLRRKGLRIQTFRSDQIFWTLPIWPWLQEGPVITWMAG